MTVVQLDVGIPMGPAWIECYNRCLAEHNAAKEKAEAAAAAASAAGDGDEQGQGEAQDQQQGQDSQYSGHRSHITLLQNHCNQVFNENDKESLSSQLGARAKPTGLDGKSLDLRGYGPVTCEPFSAMDLFKYSKVQFDKLTETYGLSFYMTYLARWPEYFQKLVNPSGQIVGYIMGKSEGHDENWHGHVTCLSILGSYRGQGLAGRLMKHLEDISEAKKTYFVDLFVRKSNDLAIGMYKKLGYVVYRTVLSYYSGSPEQGYKDDEDAYDMRKAMSRDVNKTSIIPLTHPVLPEDLD